MGWRGEAKSMNHRQTGRLPSLRLYSTLRPIALIDPTRGEQMAQACADTRLQQLTVRVR